MGYMVVHWKVCFDLRKLILQNVLTDIKLSDGANEIVTVSKCSSWVPPEDCDRDRNDPKWWRVRPPNCGRKSNDLSGPGISRAFPGLQEAAVQENAQQQSQHWGGTNGGSGLGWPRIHITLLLLLTQQQGNVRSPMLPTNPSIQNHHSTFVCASIISFFIEDTTQFGAWKCNFRGLEHDASYVYNDTSPSNSAGPGCARQAIMQRITTVLIKNMEDCTRITPGAVCQLLLFSSKDTPLMWAVVNCPLVFGICHFHHLKI